MRRALAACLFLALVAGWVAPRVLSYVCSMDGRARSHCCCTPHGTDARADTHAAFERAGCCEVRSERSFAATSTAPETERAVADNAAFIGTTRSSAVVELLVGRVHASPRGPPRAVGPPPYLRSHALLI